MQPQRAASLIGLGFGDCGKGLFTDYLARRWRKHGTVAVVRWNGGAQAGHNVVLPDGRHHTFSQFSAGTFVPGVISVLASPVVVHPTALLVEHAALQKVGVSDALARLVIDARCRITTPFHQAAGRLRELQRGDSAHGTCGAGVGETVRHALSHADEALLYDDLTNDQRTLSKLEAIRQRLASEFMELDDSTSAATPRWRSTVSQELGILRDPTIARRWFERAQALVQRVAPASRSLLGAALQASSSVIFEGAQGVLLDEWHGFHPHTSWSTIHPSAVEAMAADAGLALPIRHYGVLRSYLTRHGAGPLPTEDATLNALDEAHNHGDGWQGPMRRGHPDAVLLRYARDVIGQLDGLCVSHLDVFDRPCQLRWCEAYDHDTDERLTRLTRLPRLPSSTAPDLNRQAELTHLLNHATPRYARRHISGCAELLERLTEQLHAPVIAGSAGNTHLHVIPFLNHYEIRRTDDDSARSTARKGQRHIVMI